MKKLTILFLIDSLELSGGAEKNLLSVATNLNKDKYKIIVCCLQGGAVLKEFEHRGFTLVNLKIKRIYDFNAFFKGIKLIKLIKQENVKIMVTYFDSSDFWGSVIAKIAGVPVLVSSRRDMGFNLKRRHIFAYRLINRLFDRIITVSNEVKGRIIKEEGADPAKITTIYNGVDAYDSNNIDKSALKRSLGLDENSYTVTMIANLSPIKGHKDLLYAAAKIIEKNQSVKFLLVGTDKNGYDLELKNLANALGIRNNVIFSGFRSDIPQVLSISDISVLSSRSEGFSNAILEYMAAGKPVVATDVGGNRELVIEGETGYLVPPRNPLAMADAILKLLNDINLRKTMGENSRARIKDHFSQDRMINNIDALLDEVIKEKA